MAIVMIEGFDHEANEFYTQAFGFGSGDARMNQKRWSISLGTGFELGRMPYGPQSRSFRVIQNNECHYPLGASYSQLIVGFGAHLSPAAVTPGYGFFELQTSVGVYAIKLLWNASGLLEIWDVVGSVVATGTTVIEPDTWVYIEIAITKGATGTVELRLDGRPEIAPTVGNYGTANINDLRLAPDGLGSAVWFDDMYVLDPTTGPAHTQDFWGDIVVETFYPAIDGTYTQWTPEVIGLGGDHFPYVDEGMMDDDKSYVYTNTNGNKDSYGLEDPLAECPVFGVQVNLAALRHDSAARTLRPFIRQSATDYAGPTSAVSDEWLISSWLLAQDPSGSDWLYTTVNTDEYGAELVS